MLQSIGKKLYRTPEGLYVHDKGEEGVREQQKEYKGLLTFFKDRPCQGIWDLGAHVGWFVWYAQQHLHPKRMVCVECAPKQLAALARNIPVTGVTVLPKALVADSPPCPTVRLFLGKTYSSCDSTQAIRGREYIEVPTATLGEVAAILPNPDAVKIDIEGAEYDLDWKKHLPKSVQIIVAELHHNRPGQVKQMLHLHQTWLGMGFTAVKRAKLNHYRKTCHVQYERKN